MPVEPTTTDVIRSAIESRLLDLHTSIPGVVVSYNPLLQTADVQPVVKRAIATYDGDTEHETLPVIHNVPIEWPGGGGFAMQFPVQPGDNVWLIFSEAATAQWRSTGQVSEPGDLRRHDLSYACAIWVRGTDAEALGPLLPPNEARMDCPAPFVFAPNAAGQALALPVARANPILTYLALLHAAVVAIQATLVSLQTVPTILAVPATGTATTASGAAVTAATAGVAAMAATAPSTVLKA